jgi:hypothetical protein
MNEQQARSDERDNRRVFAWGILAAIVVMLGALAYFYVVHKRLEVPVQMPPAQTAPSGEAQGAPPGK